MVSCPVAWGPLGDVRLNLKGRPPMGPTEWGARRRVGDTWPPLRRGTNSAAKGDPPGDPFAAEFVPLLLPLVTRDSRVMMGAREKQKPLQQVLMDLALANWLDLALAKWLGPAEPTAMTRGPRVVTYDSWAMTWTWVMGPRQRPRVVAVVSAWTPRRGVNDMDLASC